MVIGTSFTTIHMHIHLYEHQCTNGHQLSLYQLPIIMCHGIYKLMVCGWDSEKFDFFGGEGDFQSTLSSYSIIILPAS